MLLRDGVAYSDLAEWLKRLYVDVAEKDFAVEGKKQTVSRLSVLTGLNRKEVKRLIEEPMVEMAYEPKHNRAQRVVSGWMSDTDFLDEQGQARLLEIDDSDSGFNTLVKRYSGDITPRAILDELQRVGVVETCGDNQLRLLKQGYVPHRSEKKMLQVMGESGADMLETMDFNLSQPGDASRLQMRVAYDNLPQESVDIFRGLSRDKSHELLLALDQFLSTQDRDSNPASQGQGRYRAGLGVYYFEQELDDDNPQ